MKNNTNEFAQHIGPPRRGVYWILFLIVFSTIAFAEKIAVFPGLKRPRNIIIDHNRMFISDCPEIYIYSLKDFNLIKKFGRAGAGPGEFRPTVIHFKINVQPGYIFVNSSKKASYFTKDGKLYQLIENEDTEEYELFVTEIQ